jgi:hypothetical protein
MPITFEKFRKILNSDVHTMGCRNKRERFPVRMHRCALSPPLSLLSHALSPESAQCERKWVRSRALFRAPAPKTLADITQKRLLLCISAGKSLQTFIL